MAKMMTQQRNSIVLLGALLLALTLGCNSGPSGGRRFDGPGPVELHGDITVNSGAGPQLEKVFFEDYYPAISSQPGFRHSNLLRVPDSNGRYLLTLAFESEDLRLRWAQSDIHQEVWPKMQQHMSGGAPREVRAYGIVEQPAE